jgi:hypothetical protein
MYEIVLYLFALHKILNLCEDNIPVIVGSLLPYFAIKA